MKFGMFFEHQVPRPWEVGDEARVFAEALEQIDHAEAAVFLAGVRHVQLEPAWGGSQDTAAPLRAACAAARGRRGTGSWPPSGARTSRCCCPAG